MEKAVLPLWSDYKNNYKMLVFCKKLCSLISILQERWGIPLDRTKFDTTD